MSRDREYFMLMSVKWKNGTGFQYSFLFLVISLALDVRAWGYNRFSYSLISLLLSVHFSFVE